MGRDALYTNDFMANTMLPIRTAFSDVNGDLLPHVPALLSTQLQLELLLQESWIDLKAVSQVILSDAGATLQTLRMIGEEFPEKEGRPTRIEDCIASLNMDRFHEAVCASTLPHDSAARSVWQHCRRVAQCARELAQCLEGFSPEEAYVVGLLCEVGRFPRLLGWNTSRSFKGEQDVLGLMLAAHWKLPEYLVAAIREQQEPVACTQWTGLLQMASLAAMPVGDRLEE
jgi:HD-like signal output (HDOD) protein